MKNLNSDQMCVAFVGNGAGEAVGCGLLMELAGAPWAAGISIVGTPLAGFAFGMAWTAFSSWVCYKVTSAE